MSAELLLVETSATMRHVLREHLLTLGFGVQDVASHADAIERLDSRLKRFDDDFAGIVFGWPAVSDADADALAERLERDDVVDLPVVVMSTDLRAETRAWVAARAHTAMVAWRRFRDIDSVLEQLIDTEDGPVEPAAKFDNRDVRLLIVDDSATIRRSLRDLFSQQGYETVLAADRLQALSLAREQAVDVAIVDFYLGDDTGDRVCRELVADPDTGDVVCAVLTGTYSDHIIRRSLRAGALECLFKNESSELLLNRVHAMSRFVRQKRHLIEERRRLDRVVGLVAGAALVVDSENAIRNVSDKALTVLGHDAADALIGQPLSVITSDARAEYDVQDCQLEFRRADGARAEVIAQRRSLGQGMGAVLQFEVFEKDDLSVSKEASAAHSADALLANATTPHTKAFMSTLTGIVEGRAEVRDQASLLLLRLWQVSDDGDARPIEADSELEASVTPRVISLYRRRDHVVALGGARFGFVIRHPDEPQSWLLTRKIMQLANELLLKSGGERMASTAALMRIDDTSSDAQHCLTRVHSGLEYVDARWSNKALLIGPRRALSVYPDAPEEPADTKSGD